MTLCLVGLALLAAYLGAVGAAFAALMRLSLRLLAERSGKSGRMKIYLDDPIQLFLPVRAMLGAVHVAAALCFAGIFGLASASAVLAVAGSAIGFVLVFEHLVPYLIVRRDPERVLDALLPSFDALARLVWPVVFPFRVLLASKRERTSPPDPSETLEEQQQAATAYLDAGEQEGILERDERQLLQSIVDFSDTLVREVMTPRPDIVAIRADATLAELRAFFREQEYSRIPVYVESLDNIAGFVFIKDLMRLPENERPDRPVSTMVRPAYVVPETKRVSDLLREFQRQQWQIAIVVDEYGGTAGLVTLEDLIEEIVGEIRDEYDVETEPFIDEGEGRFVVSGKADVETLGVRLGMKIESEGFETVGGWVLARLGRVPAAGEVHVIDDLTVEILDAERRRVHRVRVSRGTDEAAGGDAGADLQAGAPSS
jgi:putative hemolysin